MKSNRSDVIRGPRACWRSRSLEAVCDVCGANPVPVHIPMHEAGFYCGRHCPCCTPPAVDIEAVAMVTDRLGESL